MSSQQNNGTMPCANNCGFFGTAEKRNLCSKCYNFCLQKESALYSAVPPPAVQAAKPPSPAEPSLGTAGPSKPTNRRVTCSKKVGLTGFLCKCRSTFCGMHRYPEKHHCTYDFMSAGREAITKSNPIIKGDKLNKF